MLCGGIDFGGTKIEARLFDGEAVETVEYRRCPTPQDSFEAMIEALCDEIRWLESFAPGLPIGISTPGVIDPITQESYAANIPATGRKIAPTLTERLGRDFTVLNDGMAFTFSEAHGGAADDAHAVVGLTLGTGIGGGYCLGSTPAWRHAGIAVEIAHTGIPARALARHDLPLWDCGCGRLACYESYVSGTGMGRLAQWKLGGAPSARRLDSDPRAGEVLAIWADLAAECLQAVQLTLDPDCLVIGGGLCKSQAAMDALLSAFPRYRFGPVRQPEIRIARHGDSSGARGAAILAKMQSDRTE